MCLLTWMKDKKKVKQKTGSNKIIFKFVVRSVNDMFHSRRMVSRSTSRRTSCLHTRRVRAIGMPCIWQSSDCIPCLQSSSPAIDNCIGLQDQNVSEKLQRIQIHRRVCVFVVLRLDYYLPLLPQHGRQFREDLSRQHGSSSCRHHHLGRAVGVQDFSCTTEGFFSTR